LQKSNEKELEYRLRKLYITHIDSIGYHRWPIESQRWHELLFSLLFRVNSNQGDKIRDIIENLSTLELLDVNLLASIPEVNSGIDVNSTHAKRIAEILKEYEFTDRGIKNSILVMHEAAKSLKEHYDGKIQKYFRRYGQQMISEITQNFSFSNLNRKDLEFVFTFWLQNVLNMPISLNEPHISKFSKEFGIGVKEFIDVVDKTDLNIALADDLIRNWYFSKKMHFK
jgi:hypothetical protein